MPPDTLEETIATPVGITAPSMITKSEESRRNPRGAAPRTKCFHVSPSSHWWSKSSDSKVTATAQSSGASRRIERTESSCGLGSGSHVAAPTVENFGVSDLVENRDGHGLHRDPPRPRRIGGLAAAGLASQPYLPCASPYSAGSSPPG